MPVYRIATPEDVPALTALINDSLPRNVAQGYSEFAGMTFTEAQVMFMLNRPREKWGIALAGTPGNEGAMQAYIEAIWSKMPNEKLIWWGLFGVRSGLGLQAIRTNRDEACKHLIAQFPQNGGWEVTVRDVSPTATIANEYLAAKFGAAVVQTTEGIAGRLRYQTTVAALRTAAGL